MKKVQDRQGNIVTNMMRSATGALVMKDNTGYQKYMEDRQRVVTMNEQSKRIDNMAREMAEIKGLLLDLIKNQGK